MPCIINAESGTGLTNSADGSGLLKVQSGGKTTNALAWVNFNGTGTVAIRSSYNVSSITDNGVGDYTVNFATALSDANYVAVGNDRQADLYQAMYQTQMRIFTTSSLRINCALPSSGTLTVPSLSDREIVSIAIFGN